MPLDPAQARRVYDRVGRLQDTQSFYERPAIRAMLAAGEFGGAQSVFEFGCGTGALAVELLRDHLPPDATYLGVDVSPRMVAIASRRLGPWAGRARVELTEGRPPFGPEPGSVDRFVATYVFDLLPDDVLHPVIAEAHRLLGPDGRLCVTSLTHGGGPASRVVSGVWEVTSRHVPALTGGCRPIQVDGFLHPSDWRIAVDRRVVAWLVSSQVIVAALR